jgi:hypothetical protein
MRPLGAFEREEPPAAEAVAMLSAAGAEWFRRHGERVEALRVLGVYGWRREDVGAEWRNTCVTDRWGVPLCEAVVRSKRT